MSNHNHFIELRLKGSPEDGGKVRLYEFLDFLGTVRVCLKKLDQHISGSEIPSTFYRIKELKAESASITLEAVPYKREKDFSSAVLDQFVEGIDIIQEKRKLPKEFDKELLEDYKGLTAQLRKHISSIEIRRPDRAITITKQLEVNIEKLLGEIIHSSRGTVVGYLDIVNVHSGYQFYIYPPIGPTKILCQFKEQLLNSVKQAIKRYVNITGTLHYREKELFPTKIDVEEIEIYPPEKELPTLASLKGMAPEITGNMDSVTFMRRFRNTGKD